MSDLTNVLRAKRLQAYNLFVQGHTIREMAEELQVTRSRVERWVAKGKWRQRVERMNEATQSMVDTVVEDELRNTVAYMRKCIPQRIAELEKKCQDGNVAAILAWLNRAGLPAKGEGEEKIPRVIEARNDLVPAKKEETE